jgi:UDP-N-acetylmuramate dehydrogenase
LVSTSIREGLGGLENLVGVPGTVGGALRTNAGDRGNHVGQWLRKATVLTRNGELFERGQDDLSFAYRQSSLDELAIITAEFELEREDPRELTRRMQKTWIVKQSTQPNGNQGTCLLFKDPIGVSARELMEQADLKNLAVGGVSLYERNLNFAVVAEGASCRDVMQLMDQVRRRVLDSAGVELEPTVDVW